MTLIQIIAVILGILMALVGAAMFRDSRDGVEIFLSGILFGVGVGLISLGAGLLA